MRASEAIHWVATHRDDPAAFEAAKQTVLALALASAPAEHRDAAKRLLVSLEIRHRGRPPDGRRLRDTAVLMTAALGRVVAAIEALEGRQSGAKRDSISRRN
jgi:hypothetical protein